MTIDECVIGYKPRKEIIKKCKNQFDEIPLVYIPRKPHPNGLLIYLSSTEIFIPCKKNKVPFVLNIFPNLNNGFNISPSTYILKIINDFPKDMKKPVLICDAAFGSIDLGLRIIERGGNFHFSMSLNHIRNISIILSYKLLVNKSRVCKNNNNNFLFSCMMVEPTPKNFSFQNIMSSFYLSSETLSSIDSSNIKDFPIYSEKELKKIKRDELRNICKDFELENFNSLKKIN